MEGNCTLCPRNCKVDRQNGKKGICGQTVELKVARAALHFWEEPCISGESGSGAVFFSGCPLHCVFCQNENIANGTVGKNISVERLSEIFMELQEKGANNINLVTPGHFAPQIVKALDLAKKNGLKLPIVYNTSSYESLDTIKMLDGYVDIYLPDFKYMDTKLSEKYSHAPDYASVAKEILAEMVRQTGKAVFADEEKYWKLIDEKKNYNNKKILNQLASYDKENGMESSVKNEHCDKYEFEDGKLILRGTIVRHLSLPGCMEDSKAVLAYLHETYGDEIFISIMNQFTPLSNLEKYPELNRRITEEEYEELVDYAINLGIENGFIQEGETAEESFIPEFDCEGV